MCLLITSYNKGQGVKQGAHYSGNCKARLMLCKDGIRIVTDNSNESYTLYHKGNYLQ